MTIAFYFPNRSYQVIVFYTFVQRHNYKFMTYIENTTIEALQNGNHKAFEEVFLTYFDKVKFLLNGLLKSESDAEELAQDIFVKLWINRQSIDTNKSFNSYLYTIARNAALNYLKHKLVEENFKNNFNGVDAEQADSSDEILFAKEINLLIEMAVCRMPVQRKRIYQMSREKDISNNGIAEELGISKKTVENQLSLALQEIKRVISAFLVFFL